MRKINIKDVDESGWTSPKQKFAGFSKAVSEALGRDPLTTDLRRRHPFDVEITRVSPGKTPYPFHSHSAQWEFYFVLSGHGKMRHQDGTAVMEAGDALIFEPDQPHQIINDSSEDLILLVVADNPFGESSFYPDSNKWLVRSPERRLLGSEPLDYYQGEE